MTSEGKFESAPVVGRWLEESSGGDGRGPGRSNSKHCAVQFVTQLQHEWLWWRVTTLGIAVIRSWNVPRTPSEIHWIQGLFLEWDPCPTFAPWHEWNWIFSAAGWKSLSWTLLSILNPQRNQGPRHDTSTYFKASSKQEPSAYCFRFFLFILARKQLGKHLNERLEASINKSDLAR